MKATDTLSKIKNILGMELSKDEVSNMVKILNGLTIQPIAIDGNGWAFNHEVFAGGFFSK